MAQFEFDLKHALERVGELLSGEARNSIVEQRDVYGRPFKPLEPKTIRRKGSSKALIDTGTLLNSVSYRSGANFVEVGVEPTAPYGIFHWRGAKHIPRRAFLPTNRLPREWKQIIKREFGGSVQFRGARKIKFTIGG